MTYTYDAWGKVTSVTGTDAETVGKYNSLRYRGYYYDSETGYYYLQSRYYDPGYKRFINADDPELITDLTQASVLGGNLFAYCENNAVNDSDPSGERAGTRTPRYTIIFYYANQQNNFREQAEWMKNNYLSNKSVKMIPVTYFNDFKDYWDSLSSIKVESIFLYLHGGEGCLSFLGSNPGYSQIQKLTKLSITGKVYLMSCQGGTSFNGSSVAYEISKRVNYKKVRAVVKGNVYYRAWNQWFSRKPLTKQRGAYWADFYFTKDRKGKYFPKMSKLNGGWSL